MFSPSQSLPSQSAFSSLSDKDQHLGQPQASHNVQLPVLHPQCLPPNRLPAGTASPSSSSPSTADSTPNSCKATNGTDAPPARNHTGQTPQGSTEAGRGGHHAGAAPLTAANLDASQAEREADNTASQQRVAEAARELGFELPAQAMGHGYGSSDGPMERWTFEEGPYSRTVASSYDDKGKSE